MSFLNELKRRNVLRVGAAYIVTAWLVIQVVETIFPAFGFGDAAIRFVTIAFVIGLLPVLVVAWVFELTPEGLKRDSEVDQGRPASLQAAKRLDRIILVVLALALGYFAFDKFVLDPSRDAEMAEAAREEGRSEALIESYGEASIAVLAFDDMSQESDQAYFSDGIAGEIMNLLASVPGVRVTGRTSSFSYRNRGIPIAQIAEELDVAYVLEGSVRKAGDQVRITAQLIEARSDTHVWSANFDRVLDDIFAIQDEIAAEVVNQLQITLTGPALVSRRTDPEAYALTLQARQLQELRSGAHWVQIESLLERALALDSDYVPAMEVLILHYSLQAHMGAFPEEEAERQWQELRSRILLLEPENSTVRAWDAWELYENDHQIEAAIGQYLDLIRREPNNSELLRSAGVVMRRTGYFGQAVEVLSRCIELDPLKHSCLVQLKEAYMWWGKLDEARTFTDRLKVMWNQPFLLHDFLLLLQEGKAEQARSLLSESRGTKGFDHALLALAEFELGDLDALNRYMPIAIEEQQRDGNAHLAMMIAGVYAFAGEPDEAFRWLKTSHDADNTHVFMGAKGPFLRKLHGDPRWDSFLERVGLGNERLGAFEFEVPLPD